MKQTQVLMHLVHPCHGSLLPSTVSNTFALVNSILIHISGHALVSQKSLGVPHTSLPVLLLQDCQHLLVGAHVHLVRFRAVSHHVWSLSGVNIFHASQLLVSLGGCQLEPCSLECEHEFTLVAIQVFKCSHGNEGREPSGLVPMGLLVDCDACMQLVQCIHCLQLQSKDILGQIIF